MRQSVLQDIPANGQFYLAPVGEVGSHHLQQGTRVHLAGAGLADGDRKTGVSDGADKHRGRTCMQTHRCCHHGLLC